MHKETETLKRFYSDKTVLLTGVHGFKPSWLSALLVELGAKKIVAVGIPSDNNILYKILKVEEDGIDVRLLDVRDHDAMISLFLEVQPDVVFHLAAQAIVSAGYKDPYLTFSSNTMGTVNVLDGIRALDKKVSAVLVTTDKAYFDASKEEGYDEEDLLLGRDPYSASKSAAEHAIYCFNKSYFEDTLSTGAAKIVSPCRAGNVIGGGDFSADRLVPDMVRALDLISPVTIRNFVATRPYEHVLDAVYAYALLAYHQWMDSSVSGAYNIGPNDTSIMSNGEVIDYFEEHSSLQVNDMSDHSGFHETKLLKLNSSKFRQAFDWSPRWGTKQEILSRTFDWYNNWIHSNRGMKPYTYQQIREFLNG
jgi:CDP-glucose 4,6-dehydratase